MAIQHYRGITELLQLGKRLELKWYALKLPTRMPDEQLLRQIKQLLPEMPLPIFSLPELENWLTRHGAIIAQRQTRLEHKRRQLKKAVQQLAGQYEQACNNLQNAQQNRAAILQAVNTLTLQQDLLVTQATRLSQLLGRMPENAIYKDKRKQALKQADKFKSSLLHSQASLEKQRQMLAQAEHDIARLALAQRQAHQARQHNRLPGLGQRLNAESHDLQNAQTILAHATNIKQKLEVSIAHGKTAIKAWFIKDDNAAREHMAQAIEQARLLADKISRWERLLLSLDTRLAKRINLLQAWHQENKTLSRRRAALEAELQVILAEINTDNYREHINGSLGLKLNAAGEQLKCLLENARLLEQQGMLLAKAIPLELERGRLWTEQWRLAGKEQRTLLTQAAAWQQEAIEEAGQSRQRLAQMLPGWREQALLLSTWLDLWPEILCQLAGAQQSEANLEQILEILQDTVIPTARVANLLKTPVSFKQYSATWRRLPPENNQLPALWGMRQTIDYWLDMLSREFSNSLLQPLQHDNEELSRQLQQARQEKNKLYQARQRSARYFWQTRKSKLFQQAHIGELTKIIDEIGLDLNQAKTENTRLHDLLQQSKQEQLISQQQIADLLEQNKTGEQARQDLERLEGVLVHVRQEKAEQQQRLENILSENALLAAQKDDLYQQLLLARQEKQTLSQQVTESSQAHALALEQIQELHAKQAMGQEAIDEVERLKCIIRNFRRQQRSDHLQIEEVQLENAQLHGFKVKSENLAYILKQMLDRHKQAQEHIDDLLEKNIKLTSGQALNLHLQAEVFQLRTREEQYRLRIEQLEAIGLNVERLEAALAHTRRMAQALKGKMLERHRLYRQSQKALAQLALQQTRNVELEVALAQLQEQFNFNEQARIRLRAEYQQAVRERDAARAAVVRERSVRMALAQAGKEQHLLQQQLEMARDDASHWRQMADNLQLTLQQTGIQDKASQRWQQEAAHSAAKASQLEEKINKLLLQVQNPRPRQAFISHGQTGRVLGSLQQARRSLKDVGKNILHGWALIAVLSGSLLLGTPTISGTAALPAQGVSFLSAEAQLKPQAIILQHNVTTNLDLRPPKTQDAPLPRWMEQMAIETAVEYNLPQETVIVNALTIWAASDNLDPENVKACLQAMAGHALGLLNSSPHIARSMDRQTLTNEAAPQSLFHAKLFNEYCSLGHTPAQALGAMSSNLWASRQLGQNTLGYKGRVMPLPAIEKLDARRFVQRISPYIESRMKRFMASHAQPYQGEAANYARNLALDIYESAEAFAVPKTLMLAIAHQETFYANVLGDSNRSASPFQLFAPTRSRIINDLTRAGFVAPPANIRLERHLTMATYMAAFHLKQLITKSSDSNFVYTDRLLRNYNGASVYAGLVDKRQQQLANYLSKTPD